MRNVLYRAMHNKCFFFVKHSSLGSINVREFFFKEIEFTAYKSFVFRFFSNLMALLKEVSRCTCQILLSFSNMLMSMKFAQPALLLLKHT